MAVIVRGLTARIIREGAGDESVFIAEHNFFCYLTCAGSPAAVLQVVLQKVSQEVLSYEYDKGLEFEETTLEAFKKAGVPAGASFSCLFNDHDRLLLATRNQGEIYIQRDGKTLKLLEGNKYAAGRLQDEDTFILTTSPSSAALGQVGGWSAYLDGADISGHDLSGLILITNVVEKEEERVSRRAEISTSQKKEKKPFELFRKARAMSRRRLMMVGGLTVIAVLLVVSLTYGLIGRANDKRLKQIAYTKEEVTQKLQQAEDVAFLNSGRAAGLINDAKHDISELKAQVGGAESAEIKELDDLIAKTEATIFKKEEKQPIEFFDLAIEDQNARGKLIARSGDRTAIVNPDGTVYLLNLEKKSLDKQSSGVKDPTGVALGETSVFVVGSNGIVQIDAEGKAKKVLEKDNDWAKVSAVASFNNNLYVLDGGKGMIYKYVPTENGYGGKSSYLTGNGPSLAGANSIAIDASVYVSNDSAIFKFTTGLQEGFAPQFPQSATITKIDSAEDVEKVYAWDKSRGLLYILSKNGSYERQIKSAALKSAVDIVVTKDNAYLLQGQKIYRIALN